MSKKDIVSSIMDSCKSQFAIGASKLYGCKDMLCRANSRSKKLSDEFGQYTLILRCGSCLRERRTTPNMIAHILG
jgi:hypothetical protein